MKPIKVRKAMLLLTAFLFLLGSFVIPSSDALSQTGSVVAAATVSDPTPEVGDQVVVTISIDMSAVNSPDNTLGSYTATLTWDPSVISYASNSGAPPSGFTGAVNTNDAATGTLSFNGANATGATGVTVAIVLTFNVVGGGNASLDLNFSAMAAATTFNNLLGILTVNEETIVAEGGSATGIVELDGVVSTNNVQSGDSISISHTTGVGDNRLMLVGVSWNSGDSEKNITSVIFAYGTSEEVEFSQVYKETATATGTTSGPRYSAIWGSIDAGTGELLAVPAGTAGTLTITFDVSVANGIVAGVANFKGVDPIEPLGTPNGANTDNTVATVSVDLTTSGTELVFDNAWAGGASAPTIEVNASQDQLWNIQAPGSSGSSAGGASTKQASAGTTTMNWTRTDDGYMALAAVPINPAAGEPPVCYALTLTSGANGAAPTASPAQSTGCSAGNYVGGQLINLTAHPNSGYQVASWSGTNNDSLKTLTNQLTMPAEIRTVNITYELIPVTVTFTGTELLGRPTDKSISVKVVPDANIDLYYEYGTTSGVYTGQTDVTTATAGVPKTVVITGLNPNTQYFYRMQYRASGGSTYTPRPEGSFWTQRAEGSTFSFTITTDSHVDILLGNETTWMDTITDVANDHGDFHFDLGDTVAMYDNVGIGDVEGAETVYKDQYEYFNVISHSSPIFLIPGNHENHEGWHYYNGTDSRNILAVNALNKYYLNPVPDEFYSGDEDTDTNILPDGYTGAYYSFNWGDALFVVINPYWYTTQRPYQSDPGGGDDSTITGTGDTWDWTLGKNQFDWLKATLAESDAKYKFVITHQLVSDGSWSGQEDYGHGGANTNHIGEWGGYDEDGATWGWDDERPGWGDDPIHDILVANCVSAVFKAHDHQYAYEIKDDVVYQTLPASGFTQSFNGYTTGEGYTIMARSNPGHLKVTVGPDETTVDYIRTNDTTVDYSYDILPCVGPNQAPTLNPIGDKSVFVDATLSFTATASDDGLPSGTLTFSLEDGTGGSVPSGASITLATGVFSWIPATVGSYTFDVCVSDGELSDCETITVTVNPIVPPPTQSSFFGEIHYQPGDDVPVAGNYLEAHIDGITGYVNRTPILDTGDGLAYTINVDGDDLATPEKDGGEQNDIVIFMINGRVVATGLWLEMENTEINIHPPKPDTGGAYAVLIEDASLELSGSVADWLMPDSFTYEWDFDEDGDHDDATGQTPTYTFSTIGTYEVALKVTDGQGGEGFDDTPLFVVELDGLEGQLYDGNPHPVTASGVEAPYTTTILYGDPPSTTPPTLAGTYPVIVQIKDGDQVIATISVELVITGAPHEIDLVAGWNLISFNVTPISPDVEDILESIEGSYSLVYAWDVSGAYNSAGNWVRFDPTVPYGNTLTTLDVGMGFWIYMEEADTLSIIGTYQTEETIPLSIAVGGWNLVGFPSAGNLTLPGALSDHGVTDFTLIFAYHAADIADPWKLFDPTVAPILNDLEEMSPGWGYWIFVTEDCDWQVAY